MKKLIVTISFLAGTFLAEAQLNLASGPVVNPDNGHTYYLTSPASWTDAEALARSLGGHLATIRNAREDAWVYSTFIHNPQVTDTLWVGISDAAQEGNWVWASGESADYRNWAPGEPNNLADIEDYGRYFQPYHAYAGLWNDAPNEALSNGLIEIVPEPTATALFALAAALLVGKRVRSQRS